MSAGSTTYTYDNNGNMVTKTSGSSSWTYKYDYENRIKQAALNGLTVFQALYDGDGRRIDTVAGDTTVYDYLAGSWDPSYVKDLTTGVTSDIAFAGNFRVGKVQGGINYYYHLDRLGSVRLVTQSASVQAFAAKYLPYGNTYATSGSESFQFTGKQSDVSTGLSYFGYRYLDSQSGRFTSLDLHRPNYLNPQSINRYAYALNNPNANIDRDGWVAQQTDVTPDERAAIRAAVEAAIAARQGGSTGGGGPTGPSPGDPYRGPSQKFVMLKLLRMESYLMTQSGTGGSSTTGTTTSTETTITETTVTLSTYVRTASLPTTTITQQTTATTTWIGGSNTSTGNLQGPYGEIPGEDLVELAAHFLDSFFEWFLG